MIRQSYEITGLFAGAFNDYINRSWNTNLISLFNFNRFVEDLEL